VIPSPRNHLYRLALLLIVAVVGFIYVKDWFVPDGWDEQKWYRAVALEELKVQPVSFSGNKNCMEQCHGKTRKDHAAIGELLASSVHANLSCESCHGPLFESGHQKTGPALVPRDSELCLRCHDSVAARPVKVGLFNESQMAHQALEVKRNSNCVVCHDPHAPRKKAVEDAGDQIANAWLPGILALAEGGCNSCHKPGVPFMPLINGQPEQYLKTVMLQQRDGQRQSLVMGDLLKEYPDEKLDTLAKYYANSVWVSAGEASNSELVRTGAAIHQKRCVGCHGQDGRRASGMTPRLAGQTISYFKSQMSAYLDPQVKMPSEVMRTIVKGMSQQEIDALAHYYAAEPSIAREGEDIATVVSGCNTCHRPGFRDMPLISGQPEQFIRTVLQQQKEGSRTSRVMVDLLRGYSDQTLAALSRHYAKSRWLSTQERTQPDLVKAGESLHKEGCAGCHGMEGRKADGLTPRLAGQPAGYIEAILQKYKDPRSKQPSKVMRTAVATLTTEDIRALAQYYASNPGVEPSSEAGAPAPSADVSAFIDKCDSCHSAKNDPTDTPLIDGQPEAYLKTVMHQFIDGTREGDMTKIMKKYDAEQSAAFAWHYAKKKWISISSAAQPELIKRGKSLHEAGCGDCHANDGRKTDAETPRLAGQPLEFLENEIKHYQDPAAKRPNKFMRDAVKSLTAEDMKALAHFYASQKN